MANDLQYWDSVYKALKKDGAYSLWRSHNDVVNIALLGRWLPQGKTGRLLKTDLFDEVASNGMYPFLKVKAENIIGLDISSLIVKAAQKTCSDLKGTIADVRYLPFHNNTFDSIISISTIDHFSSEIEIIKSLREFHRVLRIGGQLILTLDNLMNPVIALRSILPFRLLNRSGLVPYYVGATLGPRRLCQILKQIGFEVANLDAVMHCPRVLAVAMARVLEKHANSETQRLFLRVLAAFEYLSRFPTRFLTGYFMAVKAIKNKEKYGHLS
jgi:SAM-dependent methyltransferase